MITEKSDRITIYITTFIASTFLNLLSFYLYMYQSVDGTMMIMAALLIPFICFFYAYKMNFAQGLLASACLAFPAFAILLLDNYVFFVPKGKEHEMLYGLGWAFSLLIWGIGTVLCYVLFGGIAALVRMIKK